MKSLYHFLAFLLQKRYLIVEMAKRDIAEKYAGSLLGVLWSIIHPLTIICVFWFVFGFGLRAHPIQEVPFVVWLVAGLAPWFAFSEIISESTVGITSNAHLVSKIQFPTHIIPVVKICSSFFNHLIFIVFLLGLILFHQQETSFFFLQFGYYYLCLVILAMGISWATSALNVFLRDVSQFVNLVLQILFWGTPIVWDMSIMPPEAQTLLRLNPIYYIVEGYRDAFVNFEPFWADGYLALVFWSVTAACFIIGATIFRKLKPHFDDVL